MPLAPCSLPIEPATGNPQTMKNKLKYYTSALTQKIGRKLYPRYKRKEVTLFRYTKALGDALFLTTVAREVKKRNPRAKIHVITGLPVIFKNNPDVDKVSPEPEKGVKGLGKYLMRYEHKFPWKKHIIYDCMAVADLPADNIQLKTYLYPSQDDFAWADALVQKLGGAPILINRVAGPRTDKKNWPNSYWEKLLPELLKLGPVVEIGTQYPSPLIVHEGTFLDLVDKTSLHQSAALMSRSRLLICPVTGTLHMAAAFDLPTLCILGGSEPAHATQYANTHYLEYRPPCHNCYEQGPCHNDFECLMQIKPEAVLEKVKEILDKP